MSKRLVLCFDGIWDPPPDPGAWVPSVTISAKEPQFVAQSVSSQATNVLQFYRSVLPNLHNGRVQQKWYDSGTEVPWFHRFRDGSFGYGVDQTVLKGYAYLAATYEPSDDLFIYGFSRGAYTARSLVGLLTTAGLPSTTLLNARHLKHIREATINLSLAVVQPSHLAQCLTEMILDPSNQIIDEAYRLYRNVQSDTHASIPASARRRWTQDVSVALLGLWDTVGPLGIPTNALKWLNEHRYNFHDTELSPIVRSAYHALAIDEHRADHNATLWTSLPKSWQTIEQRWFAGAHGDLGGTYPDRDLADFALAWLQRHSIKNGLAIEACAVPEKPNPLGTLHDSYNECFGGFRKWFHSRFYRPVMQTGTNTETLDESIRIRLLSNPEYRPNNEGLKSAITFR